MINIIDMLANLSNTKDRRITHFVKFVRELHWPIISTENLAFPRCTWRPEIHVLFGFVTGHHLSAGAGDKPCVTQEQLTSRSRLPRTCCLIYQQVIALMSLQLCRRAYCFPFFRPCKECQPWCWFCWLHKACHASRLYRRAAVCALNIFVFTLDRVQHCTSDHKHCLSLFNFSV